MCELSARFLAVVVLLIERLEEKKQVSREKVLHSVLVLNMSTY